MEKSSPPEFAILRGIVRGEQECAERGIRPTRVRMDAATADILSQHYFPGAPSGLCLVRNLRVEIVDKPEWLEVL